MRTKSKTLSAAGAGAVLAYPLVVYLGLERIGARWIGLVAVALVGVRFCLLSRSGARDETRGEVLGLALRLAPLVALWLAASITGDQRLLLLVPGLGSLYVATLFLASLRPGRISWIERLARLIHRSQTLPPTVVRHCRGVTAMWAGFLLLNGLVALALAIWGPLGWWALYTGLLAYVLMGLLMGAEYIYRILRVKPVARAEAQALELGPEDSL